jgi:uncharacterized protein YkwD
MVRTTRREALRATVGALVATTAGCIINTPSDFTDTPTPIDSPTPTDSPTPEPTPTPKPREPFEAAHGPNIDDVTPIEKHVHELVNDARRARELDLLTWDPALAYVGRIHARDMARRDYFAHVNKQGQYTKQRAAEYGVWDYGEYSENIAWFVPVRSGPKGAAEKLMELWRNSEPHWENLLDEDLTHHGTGVYITENKGVYAAMELAKDGSWPDKPPRGYAEGMKNWSNTPTYAPDSPMRNNSSE